MFDTIINSIHEFFVRKRGIKRQINGLVGLWYLTPLSTKQFLVLWTIN
jgi:hypothetical protein